MIESERIEERSWYVELRHWLTLLLVPVLLIIHTGLLVWSATCHSPTLNEPGHLVSGLAHWKFQRFELFRVNPPLVRMVASLPVIAAGYEANWSHFNEYPGARFESSLGRELIEENGERSVWMFTVARWACIPFSLLGGIVCFVWGRQLYGTASGLLSLCLWCFCPSILGHGSLITPDVGATSTFVLACYAFWKWQLKPTIWTALISGGTLGLACLAKSTSLVILPIGFVVLWAMKSLQRPDRARTFLQLCLTGFLGLYVIHLGYFFEETFVPLGKFEFISEALAGPKANEGIAGNRFRGTTLGHIPVPLPKSYMQGIDIQRRDFERYGHPSYLRGEWQEKGWWYYYLYGMSVKIPLGTWCMVLWAAFRRGLSLPAELWLPPLALLCLVSSQDGFSQHFRYALPVFPFLFIFAGRAAHNVTSWRGGLCMSLLAWTMASSLWFFPHGLAYFNELVGGPLGGRWHMIHSSLDWGQDLLCLREWQRQHPEDAPPKMLYFGEYEPAHLGVKYSVPSIDDDQQIKLEPGWYAISVNYLQGYSFAVSDGNDRLIWIPMNACEKLKLRKPDAMAGYSIYLYKIDKSEVESPRPSP